MGHQVSVAMERDTLAKKIKRLLSIILELTYSVYRVGTSVELRVQEGTDAGEVV